MTVLRQTQLVVEALVQNTPKERVTHLVVEASVVNTPKVQVYSTAVEGLIANAATGKFYSAALEVLLQQGTGTTYEASLTIAGLSATTLTPGTGWFNTRAIDGTAALTPLDGQTYPKTLSIDGVADIARADTLGVLATVTVAGVADITNAVGWGFTLTIAGVADVDFDSGQIFGGLLTIAGFAAFDSPGGVVYNVNRAIEGFSALSSLPGWGYFDEFSIDGVSDITIAPGWDVTLSIDCVADCAIDSAYVSYPTLTVAGISSVALTDSMDMVNSLTLAGRAEINIENFYDILLDMNVVCSITVGVGRLSYPDENPAAVGSISVSCSAIFRRTAIQFLVFTQAATFKKPTCIVSQTLSLVQQVTYTKISVKAVEQTLTFTQDAQGFRGPEQTLTFTQTAAVTKVISRSVTQTLTLTQTGARTTVLSREVDQTLLFNVPRTLNAPMISSRGGGNQTVWQYTMPVAHVTLVPRECTVILSVPGQTVILPCPKFGDTQNYTGELSLKRTMTGDRFSYVKKTKTEKVKYSFEVGSYKAIELRAFLLAHGHELMTMLNWKGETWYVFITNNPFEFTKAARWQPKGERNDITLEFEGIRT